VYACEFRCIFEGFGFKNSISTIIKGFVRNFHLATSSDLEDDNNNNNNNDMIMIMIIVTMNEGFVGR